jgi:hypothetical protein
MSTITVASTEALMAALNAAMPGDTILLAQGVYTGLNFYNRNFAGTVTIASADPAHPAVFHDLAVQNSSGLTFNNIEMVVGYSGTPYYNFTVSSSDNIHFSGLDVHGTLDGNPANDPSGFLFSDSTNVSISNSEFHELNRGVGHLNSTHVTFTNNQFHDMKSLGIQGGGSSYVYIGYNTFTDIYSTESNQTTEHSDAIQFFTAGTTVSAHDITVIGNTVTRGDGDVVQGIFFGNEAGIPYKNVTIIGNTLVGTMYNGINIWTAENVVIQDNAVYAYTDMPSWIQVRYVTGGVLQNNTSQGYIILENSQFSEIGNVTNEMLVWPALPAGSAPPPSSGSPPPPSDLSLDGSSDTGIKGDLLTKMPLVKIDGSAHAAAVSVKLFAGDVEVGSGVSDGAGHFNIAAAVGSGTHTVRAVYVAADGSMSAQSNPLTFTVDTEAADAKVSSISATKSGKQASIALQGTTQDDHPGAVSVSVYRDGALVNTVTAADGRWAFSDGKVSNSVHTYTLQTADAAGNGAMLPGSVIVGSTAADMLMGNAADNVIYGGAGVDTLTGGGGADTFVWSSASEAPMQVLRNKSLNVETITDFGAGDKLDLSALGHLSYGGQTQSMKPLTADWYVSNGNTFVIADVDGDGKTDFIVKLLGVHTLTADDFVLG